MTRTFLKSWKNVTLLILVILSVLIVSVYISLPDPPGISRSPVRLEISATKKAIEPKDPIGLTLTLVNNSDTNFYVSNDMNPFVSHLWGDFMFQFRKVGTIEYQSSEKLFVFR